MNKNISEFINNNTDLTIFFLLAISFRFFYKALKYVFKDYKKDNDGFVYANYWGFIWGYITLIIISIIFLVKRFSE